MAFINALDIPGAVLMWRSPDVADPRPLSELPGGASIARVGDNVVGTNLPDAYTAGGLPIAGGCSGIVIVIPARTVNAQARATVIDLSIPAFSGLGGGSASMRLGVGSGGGQTGDATAYPILEGAPTTEANVLVNPDTFDMLVGDDNFSFDYAASAT